MSDYFLLDTRLGYDQIIMHFPPKKCSSNGIATVFLHAIFLAQILCG